MVLDSCWQVWKSEWAQPGVFHVCFCVKQSCACVLGVSWLQSVWINMQDWKPSGHFVLDRGGRVRGRESKETLAHWHIDTAHFLISPLHVCCNQNSLVCRRVCHLCVCVCVSAEQRGGAFHDSNLSCCIKRTNVNKASTRVKAMSWEDLLSQQGPSVRRCSGRLQTEANKRMICCRGGKSPDGLRD